MVQVYHAETFEKFLALLIGIDPEPMTEEAIRRISIYRRAKERDGLRELQELVLEHRKKHGLELWRFE